MEVVETAAACRARSRRHAHAGRAVGLVPTMGALHDGPPVAHGAGPGRVRRGRGEHLREPAAVRRPRGHRPLPAHARRATCEAVRRRPGSTWSSCRAWPRCTRRGPSRRRPRCRCAGSASRGRARRARATSTAWPPWWPSCSPSPAPAAPTSARRTSSSWPWCARMAPDLSLPVEVVGLPDRARARRPGPLEPQRAPVRRRAGRRHGAVPGPGRRPGRRGGRASAPAPRWATPCAPWWRPSRWSTSTTPSWSTPPADRAPTVDDPAAARLLVAAGSVRSV